MFEETASVYDNLKLRRSLAKLAGGVAVIKVGGSASLRTSVKQNIIQGAAAMPSFLLRFGYWINHIPIWQMQHLAQALWLPNRQRADRRKPSAMNLNAIAAVLFITAIFAAATSYSNMSFGGFVAPPNVHEDKAAMAKAAIDLKNTLAGKDRVSLIAVKSVEIEQVSGKNFHFCLAVADKSVRFDVKAAVYRNNSGQLFLTEWKPHGC